jgi:hypothetical protein
MKRSHGFVCVVPLVLALAACETSKSSNPLSATIAGPMPGVEISAPKLLEPNGERIAADDQPVTLLIENASTNGPRPLTYAMEVAIDANFTNKVFEREGISPGEGGRTSLRLPDRLATGHSYYWRARAQDGANTGNYSAPASFEVFTPIVIEAPAAIAPGPNETVTTLRPRFTWTNAPRSGPVGSIGYYIEISNNEAFAPALATYGPIPEQPNQTSVDSPRDAEYSHYYYWHVRASDGTNSGPWSITRAFSTPGAPAPPPPPPSSGGGGSGNQGGHIGAGPATEDRARQVVFGTSSEFPGLTAVFGSDSQALSAAEQLLRRTIWHLHLAGFDAGRQRNPSGTISNDKLTIFIGGSWHAYDIFSLGYAGHATRVQFVEVFPAGPVPDGGIPD